MVIAGCQDGSVLIWDLADKKPPTVMDGHQDAVTKVAVTANGKMAVSVSCNYPNNVFIWDLEQQKKIVAFSGIKRQIRSLAIAGNGRYIFLAAHDPLIRIWDLKLKQKIAVLEGHEGAVLDLGSTSDGVITLSAAADGTIHIWENNYVWPTRCRTKIFEGPAAATSPRHFAR